MASRLLPGRPDRKPPLFSSACGAVSPRRGAVRWAGEVLAEVVPVRSLVGVDLVVVAYGSASEAPLSGAGNEEGGEESGRDGGGMPCAAAGIVS